MSVAHIVHSLVVKKTHPQPTPHSSLQHHGHPAATRSGELVALGERQFAQERLTLSKQGMLNTK